jgi:DNA-directed RNA polymerase III subunit RPC1
LNNLLSCGVFNLDADFNQSGELLDLPPPAIFKPVEMWTGKQAFSLIIRPRIQDAIYVTLETKEKIFGSLESSLSSEACMDLADGYVLFRGSNLICGRLGKATLGGGNKSGLFQVLSTDYGPVAAARVMNRLAKLSAKLIGEKGFSIGIDDVTPAEELQRQKKDAVDRGYSQCQEYIKDFQKGLLKLAPGCDAVTSLENVVTGELNSIREKAASACMKTLHATNSPLIMSQCGSKGSPINIAQMVACVGQQSVGGSRTPNGFRERTLPHFKRGDRTPEGKGFVANSFYSGLEPTEFFFHTMAGREGLVDTAVKTAETGYMSRRLMKALEDLYVHYDGSVRNAAGAIMQIQYGDDSLDPVAMEGKDGMPIAFDRLFNLTSSLEYLQTVSDGTESESDLADNTPLRPNELQKVIKSEIQNHFLRYNADSKEIHPLRDPSMAVKGAIRCSEKFYQDLVSFLERVHENLTVARKNLGLPLNKCGPPELERLLKPIGFNKAQLKYFLQMCQNRHRSKIVDPGSTVGAFGAQSIGEPGTQMTLKTFHFAGVASMNVTLGVPRIKEIINASRNIQTPLMLVELEESKGEVTGRAEDAEVRARLVKGRLEKTTLGQISSRIVQKCKANDAYLDIYLDMEAMEALQLEFDAFDIRYKILENSKLKLKPNQVFAQAKNHIRIHPVVDDKENAKKKTIDVILQNLMSLVPDVVISGISTISRAVISHPAAGSDTKSQFVLYVEGTGMLDVMGTAGVAGDRVRNNNIMEVASVLGIEAARETIIDQIQYTMSQHGMSIDSRHTMLLADCMTNRGEVLGITRFGIAKMKESVLMLASFEKTTDHLFDAALHGRVDKVTGVSESIIMGIPMPTGTGMFKLIQEPCMSDTALLQQPRSKIGTLQRKPDPILSSYDT